MGQKFHQLGTEFSYNAPKASHAGGVFERCIRLVRSHLRHLLGQQSVSEEVLQTFVTEVEFTVNNRPLVATSEDPSDLKALCPNDFLLLRPMDSLPPGLFVPPDLLLRRRWRQVQYLADQFWKRWIRDYLPTLSRRQKWTVPRRNMKVNDLVLLKDENLPRNQWFFARISRVYESPDGFVRTVDIKTPTGTYTRPIQKLCLLETAE